MRMKLTNKRYYLAYVSKINRIIDRLIERHRDYNTMIDQVENYLDKVELFRISSNEYESKLIIEYMKSVKRLLNELEYANINSDVRQELLNDYIDYLGKELDLLEYDNPKYTGRKTGRFHL